MMLHLTIYLTEYIQSIYFFLFLHPVCAVSTESMLGPAQPHRKYWLDLLDGGCPLERSSSGSAKL